MHHYYLNRTRRAWHRPGPTGNPSPRPPQPVPCPLEEQAIPFLVLAEIARDRPLSEPILPFHQSSRELARQRKRVWLLIQLALSSLLIPIWIPTPGTGILPPLLCTLVVLGLSTAWLWINWIFAHVADPLIALSSHAYPRRSSDFGSLVFSVLLSQITIGIPWLWSTAPGLSSSIFARHLTVGIVLVACTLWILSTWFYPGLSRTKHLTDSMANVLLSLFFLASAWITFPAREALIGTLLTTAWLILVKVDQRIPHIRLRASRTHFPRITRVRSGLIASWRKCHLIWAIATVAFFLCTVPFLGEDAILLGAILFDTFLLAGMTYGLLRSYGKRYWLARHSEWRHPNYLEPLRSPSQEAFEGIRHLHQKLCV